MPMNFLIVYQLVIDVVYKLGFNRCAIVVRLHQ
jgi:hypothetical protein